VPACSLLIPEDRAMVALPGGFGRAEVRERLPWAEWGPVHKGIADLNGVSDATRKHFSQRRQDIEEYLAKHGRSGRQSAEKAALARRERGLLGGAMSTRRAGALTL